MGGTFMSGHTKTEGCIVVSETNPPGVSSCRAGRESALISRNLLIGGRRTSARLEPDMWAALFDIAKREGRSIHEICTMIGERKPRPCSLTAAIRVFITAYFRAAATEEGHARAGHRLGRIVFPESPAMPRRLALKNGSSGVPWR